MSNVSREISKVQQLMTSFENASHAVVSPKPNAPSRLQVSQLRFQGDKSAVKMAISLIKKESVRATEQAQTAYVSLPNKGYVLSKNAPMLLSQKTSTMATTLIQNTQQSQARQIVPLQVISNQTKSSSAILKPTSPLQKQVQEQVKKSESMVVKSEKPVSTSSQVTSNQVKISMAQQALSIQQKLNNEPIKKAVTTATKTAKVAETRIIQGKTYQIVGKGAEKVVLVPVAKQEIQSKNKNEMQYAYFIPVTTFLSSKESELRAEHAKIEEIRKKVPNAQHLAVDMEEVQDLGQVAFKAKKAKRDFEDHLRDPLVTFQDRFKLCQDYGKGMGELHQAGYAFGDIKPENSLIYEEGGKSTLRISDFGKAKKISPDTPSHTYKGNLRFMPPEGVTSQKGDVYGTALVMIRALEEPLLNKNGDPLVDISKKDLDSPAIAKRRGIEKYIVNHKAFLGLDEPTLSDKIFRRLPRQLKLSSTPETQKQQQNKLLEDYIDKLTENLLGKEGLSLQNAQKLNVLLKWMVSPDPNQRPTAEQVDQAFQLIKWK